MLSRLRTLSIGKWSLGNPSRRLMVTSSGLWLCRFRLARANGTKCGLACLSRLNIVSTRGVQSLMLGITMTMLCGCNRGLVSKWVSNRLRRTLILCRVSRVTRKWTDLLRVRLMVGYSL